MVVVPWRIAFPVVDSPRTQSDFVPPFRVVVVAAWRMDFPVVEPSSRIAAEVQLRMAVVEAPLHIAEERSAPLVASADSAVLHMRGVDVLVPVCPLVARRP